MSSGDGVAGVVLAWLGRVRGPAPGRRFLARLRTSARRALLLAALALPALPALALALPAVALALAGPALAVTPVLPGIAADPAGPASASVGMRAGTLTADTGLSAYASSDGGSSWVQLPAEVPLDARSSDCVPDAPAHCYRAGPGPEVDETVDGGIRWRVAWRLSPGRVEFLRREDYWQSDPPGPEVPNSLVVARTETGYRVIVADGRDGLLIRDPGGRWQLRGWLGLGEPQRPEPLTAPGADIAAEYALALAAGTACVVLAYALAVPRPHRRRVTAVRAAMVALWAAAILLTSHQDASLDVPLGAGPTGGSIGAPGGGLPVEGWLVAALGVPAVLGAALLTWHRPGLTARDHARLLLVPAATGLAVALPFVGWTLAAPDDYRTAVLLALTLLVAGAAATARSARSIARRAAARSQRPAPPRSIAGSVVASAAGSPAGSAAASAPTRL